MLLASFDYWVGRIAAAIIGVFMEDYCAITNSSCITRTALRVSLSAHPSGSSILRQVQDLAKEMKGSDLVGRVKRREPDGKERVRCPPTGLCRTCRSVFPELFDLQQTQGQDERGRRLRTRERVAFPCVGNVRASGQPCGSRLPFFRRFYMR